MDFKNSYKNLIKFAKEQIRSKNDGNYYESHHIVPRSMDGPDTPTNLVLLTAEEHYMAHYYLWQIYHSPEMACAFWFIEKTEPEKYPVFSWVYEWLYRKKY